MVAVEKKIKVQGKKGEKKVKANSKEMRSHPPSQVETMNQKGRGGGGWNVRSAQNKSPNLDSYFIRLSPLKNKINLKGVYSPKRCNIMAFYPPF